MGRAHSEEGTCRFSADRPISSRAEDLLGRARFAESLASAIYSWRGKDSLVIALYGDWGSGKSSLNNMLRESLETQVPPPIIVEFNPWEWAAQEQILEAFFREVGISLSAHPGSDERIKSAAAKWRLYGRCLVLAGSAARALRTVFTIKGVPPDAVESVAHGLETAGKVASEGAEALDAKAENEERSISSVKRELGAALARLERPVLVVMDDIDRLSKDEIKLLFQLVKANADLQNLVFLLLFQRDLVEKSLNEVAPGSGVEFLKKIVQVGFDVPRVDLARLHQVLNQGLAQILGSEGIPKAEHVRFGNLFHGGLSQYFENLRDVYRFLSTLDFHAVAHRQDGVLNVNPVDLIGIECLRVFEPHVFKQLANLKDVLTELGGQMDNKEKRASIDALLDSIPETRREQVREILKSLFQPVDWVLDGSGYGIGFEEGWIRSRRVCASRMFDRYFQLVIGQFEVSEADVQRVLRSTDDREGLAALFREFNRRGVLASLLIRLDAHKEEFDLAHAPRLVTALFDVGDELPFVEGSFGFGMSPEWSALRIVHWYLMREPDRTVRGQILKEASRATSGLFMPVFKTSVESSKQERQKDPDSFAVGEEDLAELQRICVEKIRTAASDGVLMGHPKMLSILYRWKEWAGDAEPKAWVEDLVKTAAGALRFLVGILGQVTSHGLGDRVASVNWQIRMSDVEAFIAPETVAARVEQVDQGSLSDREQEACRAFRQAMKRREHGKGDPGPLGLDNEE
ncbi:MAG: P-loop NTPase fold protein [Candidatus Binatia bacterium]|jgi:predicted KAP-like P-loop ATPase